MGLLIILCQSHKCLSENRRWERSARIRGRTRTPRGRRRTDVIKELKTALNAVQFAENVPGELPGAMAERITEAGFSWNDNAYLVGEQKCSQEGWAWQQGKFGQPVQIDVSLGKEASSCGCSQSSKAEACRPTCMQLRGFWLPLTMWKKPQKIQRYRKQKLTTIGWLYTTNHPLRSNQTPCFFLWQVQASTNMVCKMCPGKRVIKHGVRFSPFFFAGFDITTVIYIYFEGH